MIGVPIAPSAGQCIVYTLHGGRGSSPLSPSILDSVLTGPERARSAAFAFEADRIAWSTGRAFLRSILSGLASVKGTGGFLLEHQPGRKLRPLTYGEGLLHFSNSRTEGMVVVAVTLQGPCGVDVEVLGAGNQSRGLMRQVYSSRFSQDPTDEQPAALIRRFTLKEAVAKALGTGVAADLKSIDQAREPAPCRAMRLNPEEINGVGTWVAWWRPTPRHVATVAVRSSSEFELVVAPVMTLDAFSETLSGLPEQSSQDLRS